MHQLRVALVALMAPISTLAQILERGSLEHPSREALVYLADGENVSTRWSFAELDDRARRIASSLKPLFPHGSRIVISCAHAPDFVAALFGCSYAGFIAVPAPPPTRAFETAATCRVVADAQACAVLTSRTGLHSPTDLSELTTSWGPVLLVEELAEAGISQAAFPLPKPAAPALIQYTSGSTQEPRGVVLTHENIIANQRMIASGFAHDQHSTFVTWLPLFHDMGLIGSVLQPLFIGATCVIMPPHAFMARPVRWLRAIDRFSAHTSGAPNFGYHLCVRRKPATGLAELNLASWRIAFNGAEPVRADVMEEFARCFALSGFRPKAFYPCYGLAEAALFVSGGKPGAGALVLQTSRPSLAAGRLSPGQEAAVPLVALGQGQLGTQIAIVDPSTRKRCDDGTVGEIWISGDAVAQGYWNRAAETHATFHACTNPDDGLQYLRTGDLGACREGELYVTGRLKDMILVAGANYYPQDIEWAAECSHPHVRPGGAAAVAIDLGHAEGLLLFVEVQRRLRPDSYLETTIAIGKYVATAVGITPDEIVLVRPGALPKTTSGKVRRKACRDHLCDADVLFRWRIARGDEQTFQEEPATDATANIENWLCDRLSLILQIPPAKIRRDCALLELGLDSLSIMRLLHVIEDETGIRVDARTVWYACSIAKLAQAIRTTPQFEQSGKAAPVGALSCAESALYFESSQIGRSNLYMLARAYAVPAQVAADDLACAIDMLVRRHAALRTNFPEHNGEPFRCVNEPHDGWLSIIDARTWDDERQRQETSAWLAMPVDLARGPLFRPAMFDRGTHRVLLLAAHHLIADHWSLAICLRDLHALLCTGQTLPPVGPIDMAGYASLESSLVTGPDRANHEQYWSGALAGDIPVLNWPAPSKSEKHPTPCLSIRVAFPQALLDSIEKLAKARGCSLAATLLAGYHVLLRRYTGTDANIIGVPAAVRDRAALTGLVGYLVNLLPIRIKAQPRTSFAELVVLAARELSHGLAHAALPFSHIANLVAAPRIAGRPRLVQTSFVLLEEREIPGWRPVIVDPIGTGLELEVAVSFHHDGTSVIFSCDPSVFDKETLQGMGAEYVGILSAAANAPDQPVDSLCDALEVSTQNARPELLTRLLEACAQQRPNAPALVLDGIEVSYSELDTRANAMAWSLRRQGVHPDEPVALIGERSIDSIIAIIGILKAGAAYLPLHPGLPRARLRTILKGTKTRIAVLADQSSTDLPEGLTILPVEHGFAAEGPPSGARPDNLAYLIATSGSTGTPKVVGVSHRQICALLDAAKPIFGLTEADTWTQFHSLAFDFSVWEVFGALTTGACLVLVGHEASRSPEAFAILLKRHAVTVLNQVPSAFRTLVQSGSMVASRDQCALRLVIFGGEPIEFESLRTWAATFGVDRPRLINMYGITETTVHVTWHAITAADIELGRQLIGKALAHLELHILDRNLKPVPRGVRGEICVGGAGLARGYIGAPTWTAARFVPDPFGNRPGACLYRTGDVGRLLPEGGVEFLGRNDRQVQIRGHRVEPAEIEVALRQYPGIREAAVVAVNLGDSLSLAAIVESHTEPAPMPGALREHVKTLLPPYMAPHRIIVVRDMARTAGGKLDYATIRSLTEAACPEHVGDAQFRPPTTQAEQIVAEAYGSVLGMEYISAIDDFFALGGDSLLALRAVARCRAGGLAVSIEELFRTPRVCDLAQSTLSADTNVCAVTRPFQLIAAEFHHQLPEGVEDAYPATSLQRQLVARSRTDFGYECYVSRFRLEMPLWIAAFERAVERLVRRHPMLRTTFGELGGSDLYQFVHAGMTTPLSCDDLRGVTVQEQAARIDAFIDAAKTARPNWQVGPLLSIHIHRLTDSELELAFVEPFLDGWSVTVLLRDLLALYANEIGGPDPHTDCLPPSFASYVDLELQAEKNGEFWRPRVARLPVDALPFIMERMPGATKSIQRQSLAIPDDIVNALQKIAREHLLSLKSLLLAAHLRALSHQSGGHSATSAVLTNGRPELPGSDDVVGLFLNALPISCEFAQYDWIEFARRCHAWEKDVMPHRRMPYAELQGWRETALCQAAFNFTHFHELEALATDPAMRILDWAASDQTYFPLTVQFSLDGVGQGMNVAIDYDPLRVTSSVVQRALSLHAAALTRITSAPHEMVRLSNLLSERTDGRLKTETSATKDSGSFKTVPELFDQAVQRCSSDVAIVGRGNPITFSVLADATDRWAARLRSEGVGPESRVAIAIDRSPELAIAFLAVLKAGGCVVPFDISLPPYRLKQLIAATAPLVVVADASGRSAVGSLGVATRVIASESMADNGVVPLNDTSPSIEPDRLAYLMSTSGSTGRPKVVMGTHRGLSNRILWMSQEVPWQHADVSAVRISVAFVDSICEILGPLCGGVPIAFTRSDADADATVLVRELAASAATRITVVPSLLRALMQAMPEALSALPKLWISSGEPLSATIAERFGQWLPGARLLNLYGSTEVTADSVWRDAAEPFETATVPCGRPISGTRVYVLDDDLNFLPNGTIGEIYVAGHGLGRGYRDDPAATAAAFLPEVGISEGGTRMYRTGDLGFICESGELVYVGRSDHQVKIRGQRIEPDEVASALRENAAIEEAACRSWPGPDGPELAAYVVLCPGAVLNSDDLKTYLRTRLSAAQMPRTVTFVAKLPRGPAGKIAISELPKPTAQHQRSATLATRTEHRLAALWSEILGVGNIDREDSFLQLGGHSLLALTLLARLRGEFGVEVTAAMLFSHPTVAQLADLIDSLSPLYTVSRPGSSSPRSQFSVLQRELWSLHHAFPAKQAAYNMPVSLHLRGNLDVAVLGQSFDALAERHELLRIAVRERAGIIRAKPVVSRMELDTHSLLKSSGFTPEHLFQKMLAEEAERPFDLAAGPLMRVRLLSMGSAEHLLFATLHHLAADEWTLGLLAAELSELYAAGIENRPPNLPPAVQHTVFATWQAEHIRSEAWHAQLVYWQERLRGSRATQLPPARLRPECEADRHTVRMALQPEVCTRLCSHAVAHEATPYMVLVAALNVLLHACTAETDVVIGADCAQRLPEHSAIVGPLVNQLVLRQEIRDEDGFQALLGSVRAGLIEALEHREIPYSDVFKASAAMRNTREPLFSIKLVLQTAPPPRWRLPGITVTQTGIVPRAAPFDILINLHADDETIAGVIAFDTGLYDAARMQAFADDFVEILTRVAANPNETVAALANLVHRRERMRRDAEKDHGLARSREALRRVPLPLDPAS